jgi:hypothetical protein
MDDTRSHDSTPARSDPALREPDHDRRGVYPKRLEGLPRRVPARRQRLRGKRSKP